MYYFMKISRKDIFWTLSIIRNSFVISNEKISFAEVCANLKSLNRKYTAYRTIKT